jgi:hypothetical protein
MTTKQRWLIRAIFYPLLVYVTLMVTGVGCAVFNVQFGRHEKIEPFVAMFEQNYGQKVDVGIGFGSFPDTVVGLCNHVTNSITLDKEYWDVISYQKKLILVYHELGHCTLMRRHIDKRFEDGCPISIMHPEILPDVCINRYLDYYLLEIFI